VTVFRNLFCGLAFQNPSIGISGEGSAAAFPQAGEFSTTPRM